MLPEQVHLFKKYAETKDIRLRNKLALLNDRLAISIATQFSILSTEPLDDLIQVAREALLSVIQRYDVNNGAPFVAFAKPAINGVLQNHMRDKAPVVKSRHLQVYKQKIKKVELTLTKELGRIPKASEIADRLGISTEELRKIREQIANLKVVSQEGLVYREPICHSAIDTTYTFKLHKLKDYELQAIELLFSKSSKPETIANRLNITERELSLRLRSAFQNIEVCA